MIDTDGDEVWGFGLSCYGLLSGLLVDGMNE